MVKRSAFGISLSKLQAFEGNLIVVGGERSFFQEFFGFFGGLCGISSKHPLVKHFGRGKGWSVPEHNIEELQAFDMTAQHDKAHRQGCCQDKADGPPERGPKRCRSDQSNGRESCAVSINHWLDDMTDYWLHDEE